MRIKLVIGEQDKRYLSMLTMFMEQNHMDQVEVQAFSKPELFLKNVSETTPDVVLVDESFEVNIDEIKGLSVVAYLCDAVSNADERRNGIRCIEKFKKPDLIFKDLLNLYAERGGTLEISGNNDGTEFIMVTGFSGGTGASTFAAALAHKSALMDKKVLYLNLERLGMSSVFFDGEGTYNFDEVIYALKSQKTSLALKLQSAVRKDSSGVYYYAPCSSPMYMMELKNSDILQLLEAIASAKEYDRVIVDMQYETSESFMDILAHMTRIIVVNDGSQIANTKFMRAMEILEYMETQTSTKVTQRMQLLYNRFSSSKNTSNELETPKMPVIGKAPRVEHAQTKEIVKYLVEKNNLYDTFH